MSIDFGHLRLDGITIVDVPPLGVIHVPLSSTPMVIYGRNGVGKSRLLHAIACALSGRRPELNKVNLGNSPQYRWSNL